MAGTSKDGARGRSDRADWDRAVQRQAKALGDPTRHAIFRAVADADGPVDIATLTGRFELNHNAIRQHLAKLCSAGLVMEEVGPATGPGRPRLQYRPVLAARGDWGIPSPYEELSVMLAEMLCSGRSAREVGVETGRRMAAGLPDTADPVDRLEINAARHGFEPRRVERRSSVELVLGRCPFEATAAAAPEIVCELHCGIAQGIAEASGGAVEVTDLIAHAPHRGGCRLKLTRPSGSAAP
ncbi:MAG: helix-turn-helix domain-containing protein [Actinobacteria bacterium]|nr:helix-turn-helix domain-containing protein [Actinomycetota bacterium]